MTKLFPVAEVGSGSYNFVHSFKVCFVEPVQGPTEPFFGQTVLSDKLLTSIGGEVSCFSSVFSWRFDQVFLAERIEFQQFESL